ncbi:MAG: hypothetical protein M3N32_02885 [Actinomycetota bacterium]|nr:hypothetical protein [Actinomycetota bacterium]
MNARSYGFAADGSPRTGEGAFRHEGVVPAGVDEEVSTKSVGSFGDFAAITPSYSRFGDEETA